MQARAEAPTGPTTARPGSEEKLAVLTARASARLPLFRRDDAPDAPDRPTLSRTSTGHHADFGITKRRNPRVEENDMDRRRIREGVDDQANRTPDRPRRQARRLRSRHPVERRAHEARAVEGETRPAQSPRRVRGLTDAEAARLREFDAILEDLPF